MVVCSSCEHPAVVRLLCVAGVVTGLLVPSDGHPSKLRRLHPNNRFCGQSLAFHTGSGHPGLQTGHGKWTPLAVLCGAHSRLQCR